jgi:uncharacterized Zn-binding protein involved in type VI secretion
MANVIRLNDPNSHGGKVTQVAATHFTVGGVAVACLGDKTTCPLHGQVTMQPASDPGDQTVPLHSAEHQLQKRKIQGHIPPSRL